MYGTNFQNVEDIKFEVS